MLEIIIFIGKLIILTEVFSNAAMSWGIFDSIRIKIKRITFFHKLLDCFECTSIWMGVLTVIYLSFFEWNLFTYVIIGHRGACFLRQFYLNLDWSRANKEEQFMKSMENKTNGR